MNKLKRIAIYTLCLLLMAGLLAGCGKTADSGSGKEKWVVGTSPDYPPFEFIDNKNEYAGFDMDLIREVAERLDVELEIKSLEFDSLIASLKAGKIDAIISCMSATPERLLEADFTKPYYVDMQGVVVHPEGKVEVKALEDVLNLEFGVQSGSTMATWAEGKIEEGAVKESQVKQYTDVNAGFLDLKNQRIDAYVADLAVARQKAKELGLEMAVETVLDEEESPGIVLAKGSDEMLEKLNAIIDDLEADGTLKALEDKWLK